MKKRFLISLVLLLSYGLQAQTGITVSPPRTYFTARPGESITKAITVTNASKKTPLDLTVSLNDWEYNTEGGNVVTDPETLPTTLAPWLSIGPQSSFSLEPGESKDLSVILSVPADMEETVPVRTAMLYVTQTNPVDDVDEQGARFKVSVRTGVKIYWRPGGARDADLEFTGFKYDASAQVLALEMENEGNVWIDGPVQVRVLNQDTGETSQLRDAVLYTLPGDKRKFKVALPQGLSSGSYLATASFTLPDYDVVKMAELPFVVEGKTPASLAESSTPAGHKK